MRQRNIRLTRLLTCLYFRLLAVERDEGNPESKLRALTFEFSISHFTSKNLNPRSQARLVGDRLIPPKVFDPRARRLGSSSFFTIGALPTDSPALEPLDDLSSRSRAVRHH